MLKTLENEFDNFMKFFDSFSSERVLKDLEELGVVFEDCNETDIYTISNIYEDITAFQYLSDDILLCA